MNLDKFKDNWKKDSEIDYHLPDQISQLKPSHPLNKIKSTMRIEFFVQLAAIIAIGFVPNWYSFHASLYPLFYIAYTTFVMIAAYYLFKFYRFYNKIQLYSGETKKTLAEVYLDLRLNMERYKAFSFLLLPFFVFWICLHIQNKLLFTNRTIEHLTDKKIIILFIMIITIISISMLAVVLWVNFYYGRYAKHVKSLIEELQN